MLYSPAITLIVFLAELGNAGRDCHQLNCYFYTCASNQYRAVAQAGGGYSQIIVNRDGYSLDGWGEFNGTTGCNFTISTAASAQTTEATVKSVPGYEFNGWINVWRVPQDQQPSGCSIRNPSVHC